MIPRARLGLIGLALCLLPLGAVTLTDDAHAAAPMPVRKVLAVFHDEHAHGCRERFFAIQARQAARGAFLEMTFAAP